MKIFRFMMRKKGSISIFMAIIMLAMLSMSSVMVDGSRLRNATSILQSASDSAAMSVLAKYDIDLKDRYGLMVLSDTEQSMIQADYIQFLMANLSGSLPEANKLQELFRLLESSIGLTKTINGNFDLYDFQQGAITVNPLYKIVEPDILQKQMVEFAKYRGLLSSASLIDLISGASEEAEKNRVDIQNIESTLDARELTEDVFKKADDLSTKLETLKNEYNTWVDSIESLVSSIKNDVEEYQELLDDLYDKKSELEDELEKDTADQDLSWIAELKEQIKDIYDTMGDEDMKGYQKKIEDNLTTLQAKISELGTYRTRLQTLSNDCNVMLSQLEQAQTALNSSKNGLQNGGNEDVKKGLEEDVDDAIAQLNKLKNGNMNVWITNAQTKINSKITSLSNAHSGMQIAMGKKPQDARISDTGYADYSIIDVDKKWDDLNAGKSAMQTAINQIRITDAVYRYQYISEAGVNTEDYQSVKNFFNQNEGEEIKPNEPDTDAIIDESKRSFLPSATAENDVTIGQYDEADLAYIEKVTKGYDLASSYTSSAADLSKEEMGEFDFGIVNSKGSSKNDIKNSMNLLDQFMSIFSKMANFAINSVMTDMYMMSMFDSRITATKEDWKEEYGDEDLTGKKYDAKRAEEDELNLMFQPKAKYENLLTGELEYIIEGGYKDKDNINSVYLKIFGIRMVNNFVAMYMNKEIRTAAMAIGSLAGPFSPLVQIVVIMVLATAETALDMKFLIDKGYRIPLIKHAKNLTLSIQNLDAAALAPNCENSPLLVKYEDYLYFFLLITKRDTKLLRMADLIQLNMQNVKNNESYKLVDYSTYLRSEAQVTIKPLFMSYGFVPGDIRKDGRYRIETLNYQGY